MNGDLSAERLLDLDSTGDDRFCSRHNFDNGNGAVFGGQMLALALNAAMTSAPAWPAHSLSGYFLRPGRVEEPIELTVARRNDGRTFAARQVAATQRGQLLFEMLCSFHEPEPGVSYRPAVPRARSQPDQLATLAEVALANASRIPERLMPHYTRPHPIEMRPVDPEAMFSERAPHRDYWVRMPSAAGLSPRQHQCLLALISDFWLPSGAASLHSPDPLRPNFKLVSLNHSLWLHAPAPVDSWLLYRTETTWAGEGRAMARGQIYDADDQLLATITQEFLLRLVQA